MVQNNLFSVSCVLYGERGTGSIKYCSLFFKTAFLVHMLRIRKTMHYHAIISYLGREGKGIKREITERKDLKSV